MNFRNRLAALEAIICRWPMKCESCGRGSKNTLGIVVLRQGEELGQCPACEGYLSTTGEPVGQLADGQADVTVLLLVPGSGAIPEPPVGTTPSQP